MVCGALVQPLSVRATSFTSPSLLTISVQHQIFCRLHQICYFFVHFSLFTSFLMSSHNLKAAFVSPSSEYSFNAWDTFRGTLSVTKVVAKNVIRAGNMPRNDPYHQYIDRLFNQTIQFANRPVRRIMKQRLDQLNPLKIFV